MDTITSRKWPFGYYCVALILISAGVLKANEQKSFQIPRERTDESLSYVIEVEMRFHTPRTEKVKQVRYQIELDCVPVIGPAAEENLVEYTCRQFSVEKGTRPAVTIPDLDEWSYQFAWPSSNIAPDGSAFGLPMSKFLALKDSAEVPVNGMMAYNAMTDYHVLCNVYAQPIEGGGIQDLKAIGEKVRHATAGQITSLVGVPGMKEGSEFRHGDVALDLIGIGQVDQRNCAIVGFDSGENQNRMLMEPAPNFKIESSGYSRHRGELYIDLETGWVLKATMMEIVVNRTKAGDRDTESLVIERYLTLSGRSMLAK